MSVRIFSTKKVAKATCNKVAADVKPQVKRVVRSIMGSNFRYIEDVTRALKDISEELDALADMARRDRAQLATVWQIKSNVDIKIDLDTDDLPGPKNSPDLKSLGLKTEDMEAMKKNHMVVQETFNRFNDLINIENEFEQKFGDYEEAPAVIANIRRIRMKAQETLDDAMNFLQAIARGAMPKAMKGFISLFTKLVKEGIQYKNGNLYTYVHEKDGMIIFSQYYHLKDLTDDDGRHYPNKFIVVSYRLGGKATGTPFYINVLDQYQPPGDIDLVRGVSNVKQAQHVLSILLEQDRFATSLGRLPLEKVLNPESLKPSMFQYQEYISNIKVEDGTNDTLQFVLKPEVKDENMVHTIASQLYIEMSGQLARRGVKIAMRPTTSTSPYTIRMVFVSKSGQPRVMADDLEHLKDRFDLDNADINAMINIINAR